VCACVCACVLRFLLSVMSAYKFHIFKFASIIGLDRLCMLQSCQKHNSVLLTVYGAVIDTCTTCAVIDIHITCAVIYISLAP